ncbi:MAG: ArsA-related P-loop ATPase [Nannocystaceae bacterium]
MHPSPSTSDPLRHAQPPRRVVLCVGPGGVGKTTTAATLALGAAAGGQKVLVVTIDPSRRLGQALGFEGAPAGVELAVDAPELAGSGGSLHALLLDGRVVFDRLVRAYAATPEVAASTIQNPIYRATAENLGGALEYAAIAQLQLLHAEGRYDLIVLDTPPTANAMEFLAAPERVSELVSNPATRLLTGGGKLGSRLLGIGNGIVIRTLSTIGGGDFLRDLGDFLRDFSGVLEAFRARAGDFQALLTSASTGVILTTSASPFSVREALQFLAVLHERALRVDGVILNRVLPPFPPLPNESLLRPALAAQIEGPIEPVLRDITEAYAGLRSEGERGLDALRAIAGAYPSLPVWALPRQEPPPTSLEDLRRLGGLFTLMRG